MPQIHPEYIVDAAERKRAVVLPIEEWQAIVDALEELGDVRLYDDAKATDEEEIPFDVALREINEGTVQ
jgi:hypothetical protein